MNFGPARGLRGAAEQGLIFRGSIKARHFVLPVPVVVSSFIVLTLTL